MRHAGSSADIKLNLKGFLDHLLGPFSKASVSKKFVGLYPWR